MDNTTRTEDYVIDKCEDFGGSAAELVEICKRLDAALSKANMRIEDLMDEADERDTEIAELRANQ